MITSTITIVLFSNVVSDFAANPYNHRNSLTWLSSTKLYLLLIDENLQVFGLLTKPLVRLMLQPREQSSEISSPKSSSALLPLLANGQDLASELDSVGGGISVRRPSSLTMLITKPTSTVHYYWRKFDNAVMRPIFGGGGEESPPNDILHWRRRRRRWYSLYRINVVNILQSY